MNVELKFSPSYHRRMIIVEALAVTVIFHLALLFSFYYLPGKDFSSGKNIRNVTLLNLSERQSPAGQQWLNWLEYHDPTLIAQPNQQYGYSAVFRKPAFRAAIPDRCDRVSAPQLEKPAFPAFSKLPPHKTHGHDFSSRYIYYRPAPPPTIRAATTTSPEAVAKYPYVLLNQANELQVDIDKATIALAAEIAAEPVTIKFFRSLQGAVWRFEVISSSGSSTLDMNVVRAILARADLLANGKSPHMVTVYWREKTQEAEK